MKRKRINNFRLNVTIMFAVLGIQLLGQTATISGKVTGSDGSAIIGANVVVTATASGTVTDIDGNYTLEIPSGEVEVSFSFIGYLTETQSVDLTEGASQVVNITLIEDLLQLEDVVVIGYGTIKKSDLTGAVASVSAEDVNATTNISVGNALEGRAAGIRVKSITGAPGSTPQVLIRGITSINNSSAMWVVDGVPADPESINPNDVESIEILKDAATTAIYGANGGNGVVIVTTKKGRPGKTTATFNASHGWQVVPQSRMMNIASGPEYGKMYTEYQLLRRARELTFPNYDTLLTYDYQSEVFRNAPMKDYHLGVSGGNDHSTFSLGLGYTDQKGIMRNSEYSKITARLNSDHQLNDWLKVGERISVTHQEWGGFDDWEYMNEYHSPILMALQYQPFVPVYIDTTTGLPADEKNDNTNWSSSPIGNMSNPVSRIENTYKRREKNSIKASAYVSIEPIKGLVFESRITGDKSFNKSYIFTPTYDISGSNRSLVSSINKNFGDYTGWQWQNIVSYTNSIFEVHNFTLMAGYEAGEEKSENIWATRENLLSENPEMWYFDAGLNDTLVSQIANGNGAESSGYGMFGRLSYDFSGIVLGQINFRRDYNSKFGPRNRFGNFLSYSAGLKFTEFDIIQTALPFLNFGKIRWGSGEIGNNTLGDYTFFSRVSTQQVYDYSFDNSSTHSLGAARSIFANPSIHWEAVNTKNLGVDLAFLRNRLSVTTEWFERKNEGMIMQVEMPGHAGWIVRDSYQEGGASEPYANIGHMSNRGIEIQVSWKDRFGKFNYSVNANYTYVSTIAKELPDTIYGGTITGVNGFLTWTVPNGGLGEFYGYEVERLFREEDYDADLGMITNQPYEEDPETDERNYAQPNAQPGDFKFKDRNNDNVINDEDIGPIGNPIPKNVIGLNLNASYGWFDLNIFLQAETGFEIFNAQKIFQFNTDGSWNWSSEYVNDHYRDDIYNRNGDLVFEADKDATYPRIDLSNANGNFTKISDFYLENGSYLRVKNIQLGVTLPKDISEKVGVQSLRIYGGAQNLYTFTNYSGFDPVIGSENLLVQGIDKGSYPRAIMYTIGANIKF